MFGGNSLVIYITRGKLVVVDYSAENKQGKVISYVWPEVDKAIATLRTYSKSKDVRLIFAQDLSYATASVVEAGGDNRNEMLELGRRLIPEEVEIDNFDYSLKGGRAQIIAVPLELYDLLNKAFEANGFEVKLAKPICTVLAAGMGQIAEPVIVLFDGFEKLAIMISNGVVYDSYPLASFDETSVSEAILYFKRHFGFEPKAIRYLATNPNTNIQLGEQFSVTKEVVDPFLLASKEAVSGDDKSILSIKFGLKKGPVKNVSKTEAVSKSRTNMAFVIGGILISILAIVMTLVILNSRGAVSR